MYYRIKGFKMLKNRFVAVAVSLIVVTGCFANESTEVIESSANGRLVKTLHLHEDVMLKLIHKTEKLEKEVSELQEKIVKISEAKKSTAANTNNGSTVSSKYGKEFRAYIEASKKK